MPTATGGSAWVSRDNATMRSWASSSATSRFRGHPFHQLGTEHPVDGGPELADACTHVLQRRERQSSSRWPATARATRPALAMRAKSNIALSQGAVVSRIRQRHR